VRFGAGFGVDMELQREIDGRIDKGGDRRKGDVQVRGTWLNDRPTSK
jgi:hypothetical protein